MDGRTQQEADFLQLIERYQLSIYKVCRMFCKGDGDLLADLYSEALLQLWEEFRKHRLNRFRKASSEKTWVLKIVYNAALHYNRRFASGKHLISIDVANAGLLVAETPADQYDWWEGASCLDEVDKKILRSYLEGNSYLQVAQAVGMTETAVGTRMSRIVKKMKKYIKNNDDR